MPLIGVVVACGIVPNGLICYNIGFKFLVTVYHLVNSLLNCRVTVNFNPFIPLGTDPEDVIRNAFACFDEEGVGNIHEDR